MTNIIKKRALVLKTVNSDMTAYGGFVWPRSGPVEAPDWEPTDKCGKGLHGALWGEGDGRLFSWYPDDIWIVFEVDEYIDLGGNIKAPRGNVVFCGSRKDAIDYIIEHGARGPVIGASVTVGNGESVAVGYRGQATAGDFGQAIAGDYGQATAGNGGRATAGNGGQATAGDFGQATAGDFGQAIAGDFGRATAGNGGRATVGTGGQTAAGDEGIICIKWFDGKRYRLLIGYIGEDGLKPNVAYKMENGKFVEVEE